MCSLEGRPFVAGEAQLVLLDGEEAAVTRAVGVMTFEAILAFERRVNVRGLKYGLEVLMALDTEIRPFGFEIERPEDAVRLVAGVALLALEGLVGMADLELRFRILVAVEAVLLAESVLCARFARMYQKGNKSQEHDHNPTCSVSHFADS
jgi:hypothetical protein